MTIHIRTGVPGAGKTLSAMSELLKAIEEKRPVFVNGIPELAPHISAKVTVFDDQDLQHWEQWPDGSVVFVDEAQRLIPFVGMRAPPPWIETLTRHRHRGFDFHFITQHPKLIDSTVRRLAGAHTHLHRAMGLGVVTQYFWEWAQEDPYSSYAKSLAVKTPRRHDRKLFGLYKSASIHNVKRRIPWVVPAILGGIVFSVWALGSTLTGFDDDLHQGMVGTTGDVSSDSASSRFSAGGGAGVSPPPPPSSGRSDWHYDPRAFVPRVPGIPYSAPAFDHLSRPTVLPRAFCAVGEVAGCFCLTEQGNKLLVPDQSCRSIVSSGGMFFPFQSGKSS